jgi:hypothetical protein
MTREARYRTEIAGGGPGRAAVTTSLSSKP